MKAKLPAGLTRALGKAGLALKKASPEICIGVGIVGVIVSTVVACKQTKKLDDILEKHKEVTKRIREFSEDVKSGKCLDDYTDKDRQHDLVIVYSKTITSIGKLYLVPAAGMLLSIGSILCGHKILKNRYISVSAALSATEKAFSDYRKRVADKIGEDAETDIRYNIKDRETVDEDQKIAVVKGTDDPNPSVYARFFQQGCPDWTKDPDTNLVFLTVQERHANDLLRIRGYLFLNEVYKMLGFEPTKAGQTVGWIYNKNNPNGDNHVDFGIHNVNIPRNRDFVNGWEPVVLLDFNVDGNILGQAPIDKI